MTTKDKYEDIDLSKLPEKAVEQLNKVKPYLYEAKYDKPENKEVKDKAEAAMDKLYTMIADKYPESIKSKQAKEPEPKTPQAIATHIAQSSIQQPKKGKSSASAKPTKRGEIAKLAKTIRKDGERWQDAVKRAGEMVTVQKKKAVTKANKQYKKLAAFIAKNPIPKGSTTVEIDAARKALPAGKRVAKKSGRTYYEYRENRMDRTRKRYPYLELGGKLHGAGTFAKGGEVGDKKKTDIDGFRTNIMGTLSFNLKLPSMRKAQDFTVYPVSEKSETIMIQSDTRIGQIHIATGRGVMSQSHPSGAYGVHLANDPLVKFELSPEQLETLKSELSKTAGKKVGKSFVFSDNSGADQFAEGGKMGKARFKKGDVAYVFQSASDKNGRLRKGVDKKYVVGTEKGRDLQKWAKVEVVKLISDESGWERYRAKLIEGDYDLYDRKAKVNEEISVMHSSMSKNNDKPISIGYMAKGGEVGVLRPIGAKGKNSYSRGGEMMGGHGLNAVKVKFANPKYDYVTSVSGAITEEDARKYFVGKSFDVGTYPEENHQKAIGIEWLGKGLFADGGQVPETKVINDPKGFKVYLTKIDTTHFYMSTMEGNKGWPYHIGQIKHEPYYEEVRTWLLGKSYANGGQIKKKEWILRVEPNNERGGATIEYFSESYDEIMEQYKKSNVGGNILWLYAPENHYFPSLVNSAYFVVDNKTGKEVSRGQIFRQKADEDLINTYKKATNNQYEVKLVYRDIKKAEMFAKGGLTNLKGNVPSNPYPKIEPETEVVE